MFVQVNGNGCRQFNTEFTEQPPSYRSEIKKKNEALKFRNDINCHRRRNCDTRLDANI